MIMHQGRNVRNAASKDKMVNSLSGHSSSFTNIHDPLAVISEQINSDDYRKLVAKVDKMREILQMEKISLPHIVVVGEQSVGKSSMLEAISGIELPRAQNICTRCPLELRMKRAPPDTKDYATIRCDGINEVTINDLGEISDLVIKCTNVLTGNSENISTSPIFLTVYKKEIQEDLTLIDLPGITRTPKEGQSPTIYQDIISLIQTCVHPETAVVLHVIQSDVDFTTSESIKICQRYDPRYERQIVAVSKIDKYDKGIGDKLRGAGPGSISLRLGCVAVLNRKQEEIEAKVPFEEMARREEEFFRTNQVFNNVPKECLGRRELIKKLVSIQHDRIRCTLPTVITQVKQKIETTREELKRFPEEIMTEDQARIAFNEIVRNYRMILERKAMGDYEINTAKPIEPFDPHVREKWDDRIAFHFKMIGNWTSDTLNRIFSQFASQDRKRVAMKLVEENYGGGLPNFPSFTIIQQLYQPYHRELRKPCTDLVLWVEDYTFCCLKYVLESMLPQEAFYKVPLINEMVKIIKDVVTENKNNCMKSVELMLQIEEKVFTVNPHYMELFHRLKSKETQTPASIPIQPNANTLASDVLIGLQAYCSIVHGRIVDQLHQLCDYWFVRNGVLKLDEKLYKAFTPITLLRIMMEPASVAQTRTSLRRTIKAMEDALAAAEMD